MFKGFTGDSRRVTGIDDPRFSEGIAFAVNDIGEQINAVAQHLSENETSTLSEDAHNRVFWAYINGTYKSLSDGYPFRMVAFGSDGKFQFMDSSDVVYNKLFDINGNKGLMKGQYVQVMRTDEATGASRYYIIPAIPHALFPVKVTRNAGNNGDGTTAATYTYDMWTIDETYQIAVGQSVICTRPVKTSLTPATHGTAYYSSAGIPILYWVDEQIDLDECYEA